MNTKPNIPDEFADFYYLRSIDLMPEQLGENYPYDMNIEQCRSMYKQGLLFHSLEDALRVREIMMRAFIYEVICIKGTQSVVVELVRPLCP